MPICKLFSTHSMFVQFPFSNDDLSISVIAEGWRVLALLPEPLAKLVKDEWTR